MIIKEARGVGATVESAREDALKKLGAGIDEDVSVDVIALPKKKVLGLFGGSMAEVRAYVEVEDKPQKQRQDRRSQKRSLIKNRFSRRKPKPQSRQLRRHRSRRQQRQRSL